MTDEQFDNRLRQDAARLRYEPEDDVMWTRLASRIRERIAAEPTVAQMLARWFRPITASFAMLAIVAALSVTWMDWRDTSSSTDALVSNSVEITVDGDTYTLAE